AAQADNSFLMSGENFFVDSRHIMIAFQEGDGGHVNEIAKSCAILGEQSEMKAGVAAAAGFAMGAFAGGHVCFIADDRVEAGLAAPLIELDGPVEIAVIGERQRVHALLFGAGDELRNPAGAVKQAVMAVAMQMNEWPV